MAHEHTGDCCTPHEHHEAHHAEHTHRIGQLCCQGVCSHPEHQLLQYDLLLQAELQRQQAEEVIETKPSANKKKSKKVAGKQLASWLFAAV